MSTSSAQGLTLFAHLLHRLDETSSPERKVRATAHYLRSAPPEDAAWALYVLTGRRLKRAVPARTLVEWAAAATRLPGWLLAESQALVGDSAETIALVLDTARSQESAPPLSLAAWIEGRIMSLQALGPDAQRAEIQRWWVAIDRPERLVLLKMLTGELRATVSHGLVVQALAQSSGLPPSTVAARLSSDWTPSAEWYISLVARESGRDERSRPYAFAAASPLEQPAESLGDVALWIAEWTWDGVRSQIVRRGGDVHVWSHKDEVLTRTFPEIAAAATRLPDGTVLDGELLAATPERPPPVAALEPRMGRDTPPAPAPPEVVRTLFIACDLLEENGTDIRALPLVERRHRLATLLGMTATATPHRCGVLRVSESLELPSWDALGALRREARARGAQGLMLKRRASPYRAGGHGDWWTVRTDPHRTAAVLLYAQPGSGAQATLLIDCTFALWRGDELVPFARTDTGLSDEERLELDRWIRRHTLERFGPVRHVHPVQVFEVGFDAVTSSPRHRSGIRVRSPRILRWCRDTPPEAADSLDTVTRLVDSSDG